MTATAQTLGRGERVVLGIVLAAMLALRPAVSGLQGRGGAILSGSDEQYYFATLRSLVFDRDLDFANELERLTPHPDQAAPLETTAAGRVANKYPIGWALVAMPPYLLAHAGMQAWSAWQGGPAPTGYERPYQWAAAGAQALAGWLGLVVTLATLRRRFGRPAAWAALGLVTAGSPLLYYCSYGLFMAHAASFLAVSVLCASAVSVGEAFLEGRRPRRLAVAAMGAAAGLMLATRYSNVVFLAMLTYPMGCWWRAYRGGQSRESSWGALVGVAALAALAAAPFLLAQAVMWRAVYGLWWMPSYGGETFFWGHPELVGYLFSHRHGVFFFSPVSLLALAGVVAGLRGPGIVPRGFWVAALATLAAAVYLNAAWHCWWFGEGFGARSFVETSPLLAAGLAWLLDRTRGWRRRLLALAAAGGTAWTAVLLLLLFTRRIAPDGSTTLHQILQAIPRMLP